MQLDTGVQKVSHQLFQQCNTVNQNSNQTYNCIFCGGIMRQILEF